MPRARGIAVRHARGAATSRTVSRSDLCLSAVSVSVARAAATWAAWMGKSRSSYRSSTCACSTYWRSQGRNVLVRVRASTSKAAHLPSHQRHHSRSTQGVQAAEHGSGVIGNQARPRSTCVAQHTNHWAWLVYTRDNVRDINHRHRRGLHADAQCMQSVSAGKLHPRRQSLRGSAM